ncbi:MAG TPA: hypothetical protein PKL77_08300 [Candidatus Omnitrophota bacterium]|nr:hypothetical protein [Candidatus Omnitrophota bacterium]HPT07954.1 hypothetical protein [Candidatus Omnitrophota bacterium]
MIEINLLPPELRARVKKAEAAGKPQYALLAIPAIAAVLVIIHCVLLLIAVGKGYQLSSLNNTWKKLEPQRKAVDALKEEYNAYSADAKLITQIWQQSYNWSQKLNHLSLDLPSGLWFNEISFKNKEFVLKGSVISLQREEVTLINKFLERLKSDAVFFKDFSSLDLGPLKRRELGTYEIIDFTLNGTLR